MFGLFGYLILGILAVTLLGLALYALPVIIGVGIGLIAAASK